MGMDTQALDIAVATFPTQNAFAAALGIRSASVSGWRKCGRAPAARCLDIERITAGRVTRYDLRPDVFGQAPAANNLREVG